MFKKSFLFRKWTPHCVTFPTNLLSHTEVVKWCKLFPAYHILPQWQQHWHTTPKGKQANPQPKGCNRNVTSTTKSEVCRKPTQGTRVTIGKTERQRGKEILEGMAVQEKGCLGKQTVFCYFYYSLHSPSSTSCHRCTFFQNDLYKVGYIPLHIQTICNSTKRCLNQTQPILTLYEF